MKNYKIQVFK